jgi:hypothetical protein
VSGNLGNAALIYRMASAELVAAACRVVIRVSKLKDAVQRVPEGSGDLKMLLCDTYQAPFSTNPRIFAMCAVSNLSRRLDGADSNSE